MAYKEWKIRGGGAISRAPLNDEVYEIVDGVLGSIVTQSELRKDLRMVCRELVDNLSRHDQSAFKVSLDISISSAGEIKIKISHDGRDFDPFSTESDCDFLKKIKHRIQMRYNLSLGESAKKTYNISINESGDNI